MTREELKKKLNDIVKKVAKEINDAIENEWWSDVPELRGKLNAYLQVISFMETPEEEPVNEGFKESEDEKTRGKLLQWLKLKLSNPKVGFVYEEMKQWIAWLEKQCEQKPVEWSEEDISKLNKIATIIYEAGEVQNWWRQSRLIDKETANELNNWLKSLKPQNNWKPTEEQMFILNWVANILLNQNSIVEEDAAKKLQSLYTDLKQL